MTAPVSYSAGNSGERLTWKNPGAAKEEKRQSISVNCALGAPSPKRKHVGVSYSFVQIGGRRVPAPRNSFCREPAQRRRSRRIGHSTILSSAAQLLRSSNGLPSRGAPSASRSIRNVLWPMFRRREAQRTGRQTVEDLAKMAPRSATGVTSSQCGRYQPCTAAAL
jgi:hypothetical protein